MTVLPANAAFHAARRPATTPTFPQSPAPGGAGVYSGFMAQLDPEILELIAAGDDERAVAAYCDRYRVSREEAERAIHLVRHSTSAGPAPAVFTEEVDEALRAGQLFSASRLYLDANPGVSLGDAMATLRRRQAELRGGGSGSPGQVPPEFDHLLREGKKIQAIKVLRVASPGLGLKDAKDIADVREIELGLTRKKPCFIATAAFENADAPEVEALRAFREAVLMKSNAGAAAVLVYETVSPPLAALFGRWNGLRRLARGCLRPIAAVAQRAIKQ